MESILLQHTIPLLAGIGGLVVLVLILMKFFGMKLKFPSSGEDESSPELRRQNDVLLHEFLGISREQSKLLQRIADNQDNLAELLNKQILLLENGLSGQKQVEFLLEHMFDKGKAV